MDADLLSDYSGVFYDDQGSLPGVAHFEVDETVTLVISPACRVPHVMKSKVKKQSYTSWLNEKSSPCRRTDKLVSLRRSLESYGFALIEDLWTKLFREKITLYLS